MIYQFCKYSDGTEVSFSDIKKIMKLKLYIFILKDQQKKVLTVLDLNYQVMI